MVWKKSGDTITDKNGAKVEADCLIEGPNGAIWYVYVADNDLGTVSLGKYFSNVTPHWVNADRMENYKVVDKPGNREDEKK